MHECQVSVHPPSIETHTVLVVDDCEIARYPLVHVLRNAGYRILVAQNGEEALDLALTNPDVILLDVQLPDISGFEVGRQLTINGATKHIPIIYVSAVFLPGDLEDQSMSQAFLSLPVDRVSLLEQVRRACDVQA